MSTLRLLPFFCGLSLALQGFAAVPSRDFSRTVSLPSTGLVKIETYKGSIDITTWEKAEVEIKGTITADGDCSRSAEAVESTTILIEARSNEVRIESDYSRLPESSSWWGDCSNRPFVHYKISMPRTARLEIKDYKSRSQIGPLSADAKIETYKGSVQFERYEGELDLETYKGDIHVTLGRLERNLKAHTYKGTILLAIPRAAAFSLDAETDKGEIDTGGLGLKEVSRHHRGSQVSGNVNGGGPRVSMTSYKGTLKVTAF